MKMLLDASIERKSSTNPLTIPRLSIVHGLPHRCVYQHHFKCKSFSPKNARCQPKNASENYPQVACLNFR